MGWPEDLLPQLCFLYLYITECIKVTITMNNMFTIHLAEN